MTTPNGPVRPLAGVKVVELATDRGEMAGRLLSDLGAEVIKVEPPGGAPSRALPPVDPNDPTHSLFFTFRNCGKRSVVLDLAAKPESHHHGDSARLEALLGAGDVLIDSAEPQAWDAAARPDLEAEAVARRHPHLVVVSITAYGRTGPYAGRDVPGSVIDATSGMCWKAGLPEREPLMPPGEVANDTAGLIGAFAAVCALIQSQGAPRGEAGQLIDVSANESTAQITDWSLSNASRTVASGVTPTEVRAGPGPVYTIIATKDGFVRLVVLSPRQWHAIRAWLGEPDYLQDAEYDSFIGRLMVADAVLNPLYEELFSTMTMEEVSTEAQRRGIVATPILKPADVLTNTHFASRDTFDRVPLPNNKIMSLPSGWMEMNGRRVGPIGRPPHVGEHTDQVLSQLQATRPEAASERSAPDADAVDSPRPPSAPLAGVRVADFGHGGVGVEVGRMLAEYGADVVKVESRTYPDFIRVVLGGEMSPSFASSSRSKRSLGVNAKTPEGRQFLLDWVASGVDVVIENGSTGTMENLGLGYGDMSEANPNVVMVSSQLMGSTGEWANWLGYGPNTQVTGGMTYLWDYPDTARPSGSQAIFPDHWAGRMGALAAVAALLGRRRGAITEGCHAEVCQVEQVVGVMGDLLAQESLAPGSTRPQGNRRPRGVPWGLFRCTGDDQWVAVCCRNDHEWAALARLAGIDDPSLAGAAARRAREDEVEAAVGAWTAKLTKHEATEACLAAGVPAGPMLTSCEQMNDPHLAARGYLVELDQPPIGIMTFEGAAFWATAMDGPNIRPAPGLGANTREVAAEMGLTPEQIGDLISRGVLETDPPAQPGR